MRLSAKARTAVLKAALVLTAVTIVLVHQFFRQYDYCVSSSLFSERGQKTQTDQILAARSIFVRLYEEPGPGGWPPDIARLPDLPPSGYLPPLRAAAALSQRSGNGALYDALQRLAARDMETLLLSGAELRGEIHQAMFLWAGVEEIDPASRGPFIDARQLAFVELLTGQPFRQQNIYRNPAPAAAANLKMAFSLAADWLYAGLAAGAEGQFLFRRGGGSPAFDADAIPLLSGRARDLLDEETRRGYWLNVVRALYHSALGRMPRHEQDALDAAIRASVPDLTLDDAVRALKVRGEDHTRLWTGHDGRRLSFDFFAVSPFWRLMCVRAPHDAGEVSTARMLIGLVYYESR